VRIGTDPSAGLSIARFFLGLQGAPIGGLVLTGGDTASLVCQALGATSIHLRGQITEGFPWGNLHGGMLDRLPVATKSGGFGDDNALLGSAQFFAGRREDAR